MMIVETLKRYSWTLALVLLAAFTWWLQNLVEPLPVLPERKTTHRMDYSMEKFTVTEMNHTGQPHYRLQASFMEHFPDDDSAHLVAPQVMFYNQQRTPWTLRADEGTISADNKEINLLGNVVIERASTALEGPLRIATRDVLIRPHEQYAETKAPLTLVDSLNTTRATGMRMFVREEHVQLLSQVQGAYATR